MIFSLRSDSVLLLQICPHWLNEYRYSIIILDIYAIWSSVEIDLDQNYSYSAWILVHE